jgi:hypothetical protein
MFTIKYRTYSLAPTQNSDALASRCYDENEQIHGPFELVSKEQDEDGCTVVHAHPPGNAPATTFADPGSRNDSVAGETRPRSALWVMNEQGATIAKYDL